MKNLDAFQQIGDVIWKTAYLPRCHYRIAPITATTCGKTGVRHVKIPKSS